MVASTCFNSTFRYQSNAGFHEGLCSDCIMFTITTDKWLPTHSSKSANEVVYIHLRFLSVHLS